MYLTREEEEMLRGERGAVVQKAMRLLVALGDIFRAEKLGRITSAHVSGVSYKNIGEPGLEFLEDWAGGGSEACVPMTINPCGIDLSRWGEFGIDPVFAEKQRRIIGALERMGGGKSLSCTPYLIGNKPGRGELVSWAESSAIAYVNSVLGARTNREGGPTALASALTGRTPVFGYHLDEARRPTHEVEVCGEVRGVLGFGALGYCVGKRLGECVPFFKGIREPTLEELKALGAGLAASGSVALYHIYGVTPEERLFRDGKCERVAVEGRDLAETVERLSMGGDFGHVCIGCPHCSLREVAEIAGRVSGRRLRRQLWVYTSSAIRDEAKRMGYFDAIEGAGGKIVCDTCMVVAPMREMGVRGMATNSCKAAHYVPGACGVSVTLRSFEECMEAALG